MRWGSMKGRSTSWLGQGSLPSFTYCFSYSFFSASLNPAMFRRASTHSLKFPRYHHNPDFKVMSSLLQVIFHRVFMRYHFCIFSSPFQVSSLPQRFALPNLDRLTSFLSEWLGGPFLLFLVRWTIMRWIPKTRQTIRRLDLLIWK